MPRPEQVDDECRLALETRRRLGQVGWRPQRGEYGDCFCSVDGDVCAPCEAFIADRDRWILSRGEERDE